VLGGIGEGLWTLVEGFRGVGLRSALV